MKTIKLNYLSAATLIALGVTAYSCNNSSSSGEQNSSAKQHAPDSLSIVKARFEADKANLYEKMQEMDSSIDARIAGIDKQMDKADHNLKKQLTAQKENYKKDKRALKSDMDKISMTMEKDWENLKKDVSASVDSMEKDLKR